MEPTQPERKEIDKTFPDNTCMIDAYYKGFHVGIAHRDPEKLDETHQLIRNAKLIIDNMIKDGWMPSWNMDTNKNAGAVKETAEKKEEAPKTIIPVCPTHSKEMVQRKGEFGLFWACPTKSEDGTWCKYRPAKKKE